MPASSAPAAQRSGPAIVWTWRASPAPPATAASANPPSRVAAPRPAAAPMHRQAATPSRIRKMAMAPTGMAIPYPASNPEITAAFISGTSRPDGYIDDRLYIGRRHQPLAAGKYSGSRHRAWRTSGPGMAPPGRPGGKYVLMATLMVLAAVAVTLRVSQAADVLDAPGRRSVCHDVSSWWLPAPCRAE